MEYFDKLGELVSHRWKQHHYNERHFPEIARLALSEYPPNQHVSLWDVVKWATTVAHLPEQFDLESKFGDPPLTVFNGRGFLIEVLFWAEGTPAIHQHGFSGSFCVLHGSSIHTLWTFELAERIETRLLVGKVSFQSAEILRQGDIRSIIAGDGMYHATYHLERPSLTVVVRTTQEADQLPQYTLLPPSIAHAPLEKIATVKRQAQLMRMLLVAGRRGEYHELARHLFCVKDPYSIFEILHATWSRIRDEDDLNQLLVLASIKHPQVIRAVEPALRRERIGDRIIQAYRNVDSPDLKFLLALLRNVPERQAILSLIRGRYPGEDPIGRVVTWIRRLSDLGALGTRWHPSWIAMLRCLLTSESLEEAERQYLHSAPSPDGPRAPEELRELSTALNTSWLLGPLLQIPERAAGASTVAT